MYRNVSIWKKYVKMYIGHLKIDVCLCFSSICFKPWNATLKRKQQIFHSYLCWHWLFIRARIIWNVEYIEGHWPKGWDWVLVLCRENRQYSYHGHTGNEQYRLSATRINIEIWVNRNKKHSENANTSTSMKKISLDDTFRNECLKRQCMANVKQ